MSHFIGKTYISTALVMLCLGVTVGVLSAIYYLVPGWLDDTLGFVSLRPMHVSAAMFWIILGATGSVYCGLRSFRKVKSFVAIARIQWILWVVAISGIFYSYLKGDFGGREYWAFDPVWALPIALAWLLFLINFIRTAKSISRWPVYVWMWMTGIVFFLFAFTENYLWLLPYFREHFVADMIIQWKANGSLVGAWNQLIYGTAFFLMERISKDGRVGYSKLAFGMYFLGLSNLMFNWGHHIYTLPTGEYVRYAGYLVSMTEWVFFARIVYNWKKSVREAQKYYHYFPYRFLLAADIWVFLNLGQAILMSIPALNLYTHGTHVTVAHAMGTTIGINSMILFAAAFEFAGSRRLVPTLLLRVSFWMVQTALLVFWITLNTAGVLKGIWQMSEPQIPFSKMMEGLRLWFGIFAGAGVVLAVALFALGFSLLRSLFAASAQEASEQTGSRWPGEKEEKIPAVP